MDGYNAKISIGDEPKKFLFSYPSLIEISICK